MFKKGIIIFLLVFWCVLSTRLGVLVGLYPGFGGESSDPYNRYDLNRMLFLLVILPIVGWQLWLNVQALRHSGARWLERIPFAWRWPNERAPSGNPIAALLCVLAFAIVPAVGTGFMLDRYMGGDTYHEQTCYVVGWKGHLFGPSYTDETCNPVRLAQVQYSTRHTYGMRWDYFPYIEPWLLLLFSGTAMVSTLTFLWFIIYDRRTSSFTRKCWAILHFSDVKISLLGLVENVSLRWQSYYVKKSHAYEVFLSYSSQNRDIANAIRVALEAKGISVWMDTETMRGGTFFVKAMEDGIVSSRRFVALLTPAYLSSHWAKRELYTVLLIEQKAGVEVLVPISFVQERKEVLDILPELGDRHIVEVVEDNYLETSVEAVLAVIPPV